MGKSTINVPFSIAMLNYQRVVSSIYLHWRGSVPGWAAVEFECALPPIFYVFLYDPICSFGNLGLQRKPALEQVREPRRALSFLRRQAMFLPIHMISHESWRSFHLKPLLFTGCSWKNWWHIPSHPGDSFFSSFFSSMTAKSPGFDGRFILGKSSK